MLDGGPDWLMDR